MELGFFTMPIHPPGRNLAETLEEDRQLVLLAEALGFSEGYIGEHITDAAETITSGLIFIAWLLRETSRIRLGTGTINLPNHHPAMVAAEVAMVDHMAKGRFILGISPGGLLSDAEVFGNLDQDRTAMFVEAIDQVLAIWSGAPPYELKGRFWSISTARTQIPELGQGMIARPYQKPRPEIVGTVVAPFSPGVVLMGRRDFHPLSANFLLSRHLKSHWQNYCKGKAEAGTKANVADWRVARAICVLDDDKLAARYGRHDENSPYRFYYEQMRAKMERGNRLYVFKAYKDQPDEEITHDWVMDHCVIHGGVNKVVDQILALREEIGDFGELVYAGMDWVEPALNKRSMQLMAEEVMPRVNAAIGKSAAAA